MKTALWLGILGLTGTLFAQDIAALPSGSAGQVTLEWQKFDDFWKRIKELEAKIETLENPDQTPPIPFTVTKAAYKGSVGKQTVAMEAVFEVDVYETKNWVKVPVLPATLAVTEARLDGHAVGMIQENGIHHVLIRKPGRHALRTRFTLPTPKPEDVPQINFQVQNTPMTLLAMDFPQPNLDIQIPSAQGVDLRMVGGHTMLTAALPPTSNIQMRWQKAVAEENAGPVKLYLDSQQLISVSEGTLRSRWALGYTILRRGVRELRVGVPEGWNVLSVTCDGLQEWKPVTADQGSEVVLHFAYAKKGRADVILHLERALAENETTIDIPRVKAYGIEREQGTIGIEAQGTVEIKVAGAEHLQPMDPQELSGALWSASAQPILQAFRYTRPYTLALHVQRHPEVAVLTTTVDNMNAVTVLTDRGQLITKIRYEVRNQRKQYLSLRLPPGAELWSAFVADQPVKPMRAEDGSLRIPLARSYAGQAGAAGFPVEIIYHRRSSSFWPVGGRSLTLPVPDAPVSRMIWSMYMPEKYRFPHFGGDVEVRGQAGYVTNTPAVPAMPQMDRKKSFLGGLKEGIFRANGRSINAVENLAASIETDRDDQSKVAYKQAELVQSLFEKRDASMAQGVFPVAFSLPQTGRLYHFGQDMVVGKDPELTLLFVHERLQTLFMMLMLALLGRGLWMMRRSIKINSVTPLAFWNRMGHKS